MKITGYSKIIMIYMWTLEICTVFLSVVCYLIEAVIC